MGINKEVKTILNYTCDLCNKKITDTKTCIIFNYCHNEQIRSYEHAKKQFYETFHLPNKAEKCFCSLDCARNFLRDDVDLFLAELKPIKVKKRSKT